MEDEQGVMLTGSPGYGHWGELAGEVSRKGTKAAKPAERELDSLNCRFYLQTGA